MARMRLHGSVSSRTCLVVDLSLWQSLLVFEVLDESMITQEVLLSIILTINTDIESWTMSSSASSSGLRAVWDDYLSIDHMVLRPLVCLSYAASLVGPVEMPGPGSHRDPQQRDIRAKERTRCA